MSGRIEWLVKNKGDVILKCLKDDILFEEKDARALLNHFRSADPTPNLKYISWICKLYCKGKIKSEDADRIRISLENFETFKNFIENNDIMKFKTLGDLEKLVESEVGNVYISNKEYNRQEKLEIVENETEFVVNDKDFKIVVPLTERSSCFWGLGTRWCTAATTSKNYFNDYNERGKLYIIILKHNGKVRKFQVQAESSQFHNEEDTGLSDSDLKILFKFKQYEKFMNMIINKQLFAA